ncbi:MAG TPA: MFS transporter, partial [Bordetella sp.]|nr:MFS transporter [Bordetella sp.]
MTATESTHVRRNARILSVAQALGGASPAIIISLGGLVGQALATQPALATVPVSLFHLGLALGTIPAAMLMRHYGRRTGYLLGAVLGMLGGLVAAYGIWAGSFMLFCAGTALAGLYASYVQSYRFAVIDGVAPERRARAISWIMTAGLFAAVIGTQTVIWTRDALPVAPFAGSFLSQAALALLALAVLSRLRPVPVAAADPQHSGGRPLSEIARQPRFIVAVVAGMVSYGLMSLVMTAAPIAMVGCGHTVGEAALGIQWHVLAMYMPSFFTGRLIER